MPNRILKESICTSDTIEQMTWFEEVVFYRLIVNCDDYGRLDGRPAILKSKLFPLRDRITLADLERALGRLADIGCVRPYVCDGKPYLYLPAWEVHQRIRNKKSRYPDPRGSSMSTDDRQPQSISQTNVGQPLTPDSNSLSIDSSPPTIASVIQSESESESKSNPNPKPNRAREATPYATAADGSDDPEYFAVYDKAVQTGIFCAMPADEAKLNQLLVEYGQEWLLAAIERMTGTSQDKRTLKYLGGILRSWKEKGGIDDGAGTAGGRAGRGPAGLGTANAGASAGVAERFAGLDFSGGV